MGEFNNYVFDMPKRPLNAFSLFVKDHLPDLKKENDELPTNKLIKIAAKQWKEEDGVSQSTYEKKAEKDKKRFLKQMKDFEKFGYYKKNTRGENTKKDEEEEEEKQSKKSKKKRSESNSSKSTRKTSKKSQSKTQNLKKKSTSKSSKKIAKTQKKK